MSYATIADLLKRAGERELLQIADDNRDGEPDAAIVAAALEDARHLIDGYIAAKYATPLKAVPPLVRGWAVSIARYVLHRNGAPEHVEQDYRDAVSALKDVARGLIALPVAEDGEAPAPVTGTSMASHPAQVFTPSKLRGW